MSKKNKKHQKTATAKALTPAHILKADQTPVELRPGLFAAGGTLAKAQPGELVTKEFVFTLTEPEVAEKGREMARLDGEISGLEVELAKYAAEKKATIKELDANRHALSKCVREGQELRIVEARMVKVFEQRLVQFFLDGRLLEERAMTEAETQLELDGIAQKTNKAAAEKAREKRKRSGRDAAAEPDSKVEEIREAIHAETNKRTKRSAVDGVWDG